ncbi:type II toxin-antitoxin system Phd/YefM family antitoxin [Mycobacterium tuberculosis]|uniref:type II toxin-antitoxin system Phd/YefM family antitoxin n=1 Tax=Mycobacterium tuberculosis TaxID=1773 RepID=UPI00187A3588
MTSSLVPISEARAHLSRLVRESADDDVVLMNHGRPAAILISAERYESLMEELEDLRDRLSVHEREHVIFCTTATPMLPPAAFRPSAQPLSFSG